MSSPRDQVTKNLNEYLDRVKSALETRLRRQAERGDWEDQPTVMGMGEQLPSGAFDVEVDEEQEDFDW